MTTEEALEKAREINTYFLREYNMPAGCERSDSFCAAALLEAQADDHHEWLHTTPHQRIEHMATLRSQAAELRGNKP